MNRQIMFSKLRTANFKTREDGDQMIVSGYFAVFDSNYEIWHGATESIDRHAFDDALNDDIRALINHESTYVLGRTTSGTLKLSIDDVGLFGEIMINPKDLDAVNLYERVKRGDVTQCSFGFEILEQDINEKEDGSVHFLIKKVKLYEVSPVTFPAYEDTSISARKRDFEESKKSEINHFKNSLLKRLKGE